MEHKAFMFTSIPLIGIILIFGYLNVQQNSTFEENQYSHQCQDIEINGQDRIDLLFISSLEDAKRYTDYLFTVEPYKTYKSYFNTRVITQEVECEIYQDIAILCYNKEILDLADQCEHDYVIVIKEDSKQIRSSAYGKVISLNKAHEDSVLIHELGHAIGNLAEEYGPAKIPRGSKNCVSSCNRFSGQVDGCTQECSESSYYRSIALGVMRSLITDNYGIYNINLISELLNKNKPKDSVITGNQISTYLCIKKVQEVKIYQDEGGFRVTTNNVLKDACIPNKGLAGPLCVEEVCNTNVLFTDAQDIETDETLHGETIENLDIPIIMHVEKNLENQIVKVLFDGETIGTINTAEAGATACVI